MRDRLEGLLGNVARAIWILTFHAACGRILRREAARLGYKSNFTIYDQADQVRLTKQCLEDLDRDPKRFVPRGIHAQISNAKNQLIGPDEYLSRVESFYDQTVADVYRLYQKRLHDSNAMDFDDLLMLTVEVLERFPEALRALAEGVPVRAGRRVPGHEPRAVPAAPAARRQAPEPDGRRRPRPVDLRIPRRRHPQHPRVRARLPRDPRDPARAELPLDQHDPQRRERRDREQPRAQGEEPLVGARRGAAGARDRGRGRARRGAVRRRRDRRARGGGLLGRRGRGLLPDERAVAGAGGRARPPGDRLPGDRRAALLRARRDQGPRRVPAGDRQPVRRRLAAAHRQPAEARDRRREHEPPARIRRRARDVAVRVARLPGGGGDRRGAARRTSRRCARC